MTPANRTIRIAVAQYEPRIGDLGHNRAAAATWVEAAAGEGAQLVVLPELASSGYVFAGEEEAADLAEDADTGESVAALVDVCRRCAVHVVAGLAEAGDGCRHNSAVVLGPGGRLATYRKLHLFYDEQSWFRPGSELLVGDGGQPSAAGVGVEHGRCVPDEHRQRPASQQAAEGDHGAPDQPERRGTSRLAGHRHGPEEQPDGEERCVLEVVHGVITQR